MMPFIITTKILKKSGLPDVGIGVLTVLRTEPMLGKVMPCLSIRDIPFVTLFSNHSDENGRQSIKEHRFQPTNSNLFS